MPDLKDVIPFWSYSPPSSPLALDKYQLISSRSKRPDQAFHFKPFQLCDGFRETEKDIPIFKTRKTVAG